MERSKSSWAEIIIAVFSVLSVAILAFAAYEAYRAANIYEDQTRYQIRDGLIKFDRDILHEVRQSQFKESFFVDPVPGMDSRQLARLRLNLVTHELGSVPDWDQIPDLSQWLYSYVNFHEPIKERVRSVYGVAEDIVYLINNCHDAMESGFIDKDEYDTWVAYLDEIGDHPLFLIALYYWHGGGYLTKELAKDIQEKLKNNSRINKSLEAFYKEALDPKWPDKVGGIAKSHQQAAK